MNNQLYDWLKPVALIWLPALSVLYTTLGAIWGLKNPEQVSATIVAIDGLLGTVLHLSSKGYSQQTDGKLIIDESDPDKTKFMMHPERHPDEIKGHVYKLAVVPGKLPDPPNPS